MTIQRRRVSILCGLLMLLAASAGMAVPALASPPDIRHLTSAKIKTLHLSSEIVTENRSELSKISGDIAMAYRLHRGSMYYQQPGMLRIEATIPHLATGYYVINGNRKLTSAPFYHRVQDITGAPGKKQTLLDFGLVPPEQLEEYNATFLRKDGPNDVFQLMPKLKSEPLKDIVWIDPKTHITVKRLNYDRDGKLVKWFLYKNPVQAAPGIYIPTRVEMYNPQNKLAGATVYTHIEVNRPLDQSLFQI